MVRAWRRSVVQVGTDGDRREDLNRRKHRKLRGEGEVKGKSERRKGAEERGGILTTDITDGHGWG